MKGFEKFVNKHQKKEVLEVPISIKRKPLVSVIVMAYNHELFIEQCLNSILTQKTSFDYEIILGEDESSDGTRELCKKIAASHPDKIRLFLHARENNIIISGKPTGQFNFLYSLFNTRGKYIALCDGDDYWTDPLKLQKQVDFLENHLKYSLVCGGFSSYDWQKKETMKWIKEEYDRSSKGFEIDIKMLWTKWCIQTLTVVFRKELYNPDSLENYIYLKDIHIFYQLIKQRNGYYMKEHFGVMNVSKSGVYSHKSILERNKILYHARKEIFKKNKRDKYLKSSLFGVTSNLFVNSSFFKNETNLNRLTLFVDMLLTMQGFNDFKHIIKCILKRSYK